MNLRTKLGLIMVASAAVSVLGVGGVVYSVHRAAVEKTLDDGLENAARLSRRHLEDYLVERHRDLAAVAAVGAFAGDRAAVRDALQRQLRAFPEFDGLVLVRAAGVVFAHAGTRLRAPGEGTTARAAESWLAEVRGGALVIDRVTPAPGDMHRYLVFAAPVPAGGADEPDWLFAQVNHDRLAAITNAVQIGATGRATLFNHHGRVIGHPDPARYGHQLFARKRVRADTAAPRVVDDDAGDPDRRAVTVMLETAQERLGLHWGIRVDQARAELYAPLRRQRGALLLSAAVALLGVGLAGRGIARRMTAPLATIQAGLNDFFRFLNREISAVPPLPACSADEFGQMARTVNAGIGAATAVIEHERELQRTQQEVLERLQNIASRVPGVVLEMCLRPDGSTSLPYASDAIRDLYGVTPEEVREDASAVFAAVHPHDLAGTLDALRISAQNLTPFRNEHRVRLADGTVRHLYSNSLPQRKPDGSVIWHGFTGDITEIKRIEEALRRSDERYRAILDTALAGFCLLDRDGRFVEINQACGRMLGYTRDELLGTRAVETVQDREREVFERHLVRARTELRARFESHLRHRDGRLVAVDMSMVCLPDDADVQYVAFVRDITTRKRQDTALRMVAEQLSVDSGEDFFRDTARGLQTLLGADYAMVGELDDTATRVVTLAVATPRGFTENLSYAVADTPCGNVRTTQFCLYPRGVAELFPADTMLSETGAQAYAGVTLADARGGVIGIISALWQRPLTAEDDPEATLRIFAARVGAELKRFKSEQALRVTRISVDRAADALYWVTPDGRITDVNPAACGRLGYSRDELLRLSIPDLDPDFPAERYAAYFAELRRRGSMTFETVHRTKDGHVFPVEIVTNYVLLDDGRELNCAFARDITERKRIEARMREAFVVFNASNEAIMTIDADTRIKQVNPAFCAITQYAPEEVIGQRPSILRSDRHDAAFYARIRDALANTGKWEGEIWSRRKSGELYPEWRSISVVRDEHGVVAEYLALFSDITERKEREQVVWRQANFDSLTGLANRDLFHDRLEQALSRARRSGKKAGLLFLDLDEFKRVNDTLGHSVGDELLVEVGRRLRASVRDQDTVARRGGDEFTVVVHEVGGRDDILGIGEKIVHALRAPVMLAGKSCSATGSVGITIFPDDGEDVQTLLKNADIAMYKAKRDGRNRLRFYAPHMAVDPGADLRLVAELRRAIEQQSFVMHYQPIIAAANGALVGAEALIRWRHPRKGLIPPPEFIAVAEQSGLIVPIGAWTLREVARQSRAWGRVPALSVNISGVELREPGLPARLAEVIVEYGLRPGALRLEIAASVLLADDEVGARQLRAIKTLEVGCTLDHAGAGFAAIAHGGLLPGDMVKIERALVQDCTTAGDARGLVGDIIRQAHDLGQRVAAEGVETREQLGFLRDLGIDYLQGFIFGSPAPVAGFEQLAGRSSARMAAFARELDGGSKGHERPDPIWPVKK